MVLLCSSIKNVERKKMASLVGQRSPSTPVIVFSEKPFSQYDFGTLTVDPRPESLLSALTETLKARPHYRSACISPTRASVERKLASSGYIFLPPLRQQ